MPVLYHILRRIVGIFDERFLPIEARFSFAELSKSPGAQGVDPCVLLEHEDALFDKSSHRAVGIIDAALGKLLVEPQKYLNDHARGLFTDRKFRKDGGKAVATFAKRRLVCEPRTRGSAISLDTLHSRRDLFLQYFQFILTQDSRSAAAFRGVAHHPLSRFKRFSPRNRSYGKRDQMLAKFVFFAEIACTISHVE